jgi:hypothetical protein
MADAGGSLPLGLLEHGDPAFVDAIRRVHDADLLAAFAEVWFNDLRPDSRRLLLEYLDRPLNAYRHEGLIKRLFKKAEAAGDDALMARFLVLFDRSIRRVKRTRWRWVNERFETQAEAQECVSRWQALGYKWVNLFVKAGLFQSGAHQPFEVIHQPQGTVMPRSSLVNLDDLPEARKRLEKCRLFSVSTRHYLRRRAWRYFRKLGKSHPERYVFAASQALALYRDEDIPDPLALIDNWGFVHILFHHSPVLEAKANGWTILPGRSLGELSPSPIYERLWDESPAAVVGLLSTARSSTVRRWALRRIEADPTTHLGALPLEGWLSLLEHADPEVVALAARVLETAEGLEGVGVDRWLSIAEATNPIAPEVLCSLIFRHVKSEQVTIEQAVRLTGLRALPVARLGLAWLKSKSVREPVEILGLIDAGCSPLRLEILGWLRATLASLSSFDPALILEFLDARHLDARTEGWAWFLSEPRATDDFETWRKLLESPYDDIRLLLVAELESRSGHKIDPSSLRSLWASVLLNIHRGSRAKPVVVRQLLDRLEAKPGEAPELLPLLSVALRSVRGPERRSGLVAVVRLVEKRPEVEPLVRSTFPELQWIGEEVET